MDAALLMLLGDGVSGEFGARTACAPDCYGYHAGWVLLQSLQIISGLRWEREEMARNLRCRHAERPISSLMIAGAADFGILSVVHEALGGDIATTQVTVLDRCQTPLLLCELYAKRMGFAVEVVQADLVNWMKPRHFDVILGHSILSFVVPDQRRAFISSLSSHLAPHGRLMLYQSIRPALGNGLLKFGQDETRQWIGAARAAWEAAGERFFLLRKEFPESIVAEFCRAKQTHAVGSIAELADMLRDAGLESELKKLFDSLTPHRAATPKSVYEKWVISGFR
ncbi:MAG: class I SAM-dependent methyltransferase [Rhodocyclales bacterium]|nr:class I SAM-dependent methyltransferase [Rhodocyclales bacterium]